MGAVVVEARMKVDTTKMPAQKRFRGYKSRERQRTGKADVKEDSVVQQLRYAWEKLEVQYRESWLKDLGYRVGRFKAPPFYLDSKATYEEAVNIVQGLRYTSEDVERFCTIVPEYQEEKDFSGKAGLFLSALINSGPDSEYTIRTSDLRISYLGFRNKKKITIIGNCGFDTGTMMEGGELHIHGEVGRFSDSLRGKIFHRGELIDNK